MKTNLKNKYKGMLWGLVVGDCLGSPIQFTEKDEHPYISQMEPAVVEELTSYSSMVKFNL